MGVREKINSSKPLAFSVAGIALVAAVGIAVWANSSGLGGRSSKGFFSDDDGKTWFADDVDKVPPFDHNGKEAVQAFVYRAGGNPPFVGYLQTYKPETAKKLRELLANPQSGEASSEIIAMRANSLVKRPGETAWHPVQSTEGGNVVTIVPPAGQTGELQSVEP